jgi:5-methylcytosine-specific restriction endonuclease McrA
MWRSQNKDKMRRLVAAWRKRNPERVKAIKRQCIQKNRSRYLQQRREHYQRLLNSPNKLSHALNARMRVGINRSLRGMKAGRHWESLVGYTLNQLKQHIETLFTSGMTWEGFQCGDIHIDHIIPLDFFSFQDTNDPEFHMAWALSNLQPLWKIDNIRKKAKLNWEKETDAIIPLATRACSESP